MTAVQQWWLNSGRHVASPPPPVVDTPGWDTVLSDALWFTKTNHSAAMLNISGFFRLLSETEHTDDGDYYAELHLRIEEGTSLVGVSGAASMGTAAGDHATDRMYYAFSGNTYINGVSTAYGSTWGQDAVIGVRLNHGVLSFSLNGVDQGIAATGITDPVRISWGTGTSAMKHRGVFINTGQKKFLYAPVGVSGWDRTPASDESTDVTPYLIMKFLHGILRPDYLGNWVIFDDVDHASYGLTSLSQGSDYLSLSFAGGSHAGVIHVTTDDDFNNKFTAHSNLGLSSCLIRLVHPTTHAYLNPADIWTFTGNDPGDSTHFGSGNLWVTIVVP